MSDTTHTTTARFPQTLWPLSCVAGLLWATPALIGGVGPLVFLLIAAGGTLTQICFVWSFRVYAGERRLLALALAAMGVVVPVAAFTFEFLRANTNHRPLGAVTFAFLVLGVAVMVSLLVWAIVPGGLRVRVGAGILAVGLGAAYLVGEGPIAVFGVLVELGLGILLALGQLRLAARLSLGAWPRSLNWPVLGLLLLGAGLALVPEVLQAAEQAAPLTLGFFGLVH